MDLKVKRINKKAKLPNYSHQGDAGLDVFSVVDYNLKSQEIKAIPTGIKIAIPEGFVGLIWDKSGLALKGVHCLAGVIDSGYRGEVKVVMVNLSQQLFEIKKGMKIAQILIQPVMGVRVVEVEELEKTDRGAKGFGSSGKY